MAGYLEVLHQQQPDLLLLVERRRAARVPEVRDALEALPVQAFRDGVADAPHPREVLDGAVFVLRQQAGQSGRPASFQDVFDALRHAVADEPGEGARRRVAQAFDADRAGGRKEMQQR